MLRLITSQRSLTLKEIVTSASRGNASEIAELLAHTWLLVDAESDALVVEERAVKRVLDLDRVTAAVFGSQDQKEANFTKKFRMILAQCLVLETVIDIDVDSEALAMSRAKLLAVKELPSGAKWKSKTCMLALEVVLKGWEVKIHTHLHLRGTERLVAVIQDLRQNNAILSSRGEMGERDRKEDLGVDGREALRSARLLQTKTTLEPVLWKSPTSCLCLMP